MPFDYDLFVIGGGSGGVRAARIAAADGGARVGLAEESRMGGTCVIRGCVPKKLMVNASAYPKAMQDAAAYGWDVQAGAFDWPKFRRLLGAELTRLENAYRGTLKNAGVMVHDARASLADAHTVRLSTGESFTAKHILIATGGWPFVPDVPGASLGITSNEMFDLENLPRRAAIVGGGYIASEFACILNGFGTQVTQYYRGPQILRGFDDEARGHVVAGMVAASIDIRCNADVARLDRSGTGILVTDQTGAQTEVDLVLFATGRRPNVQGLGLEALGVALGQQGEVIVNAWSQTAVPSIYAVGDVTNRVNLTPVATAEGHALADTLFGKNPRGVSLKNIPSAVFSTPPISVVGLTEEEAAAEGPVDVYVTKFTPMRHTLSGRAGRRTTMKLVVDQATQKVVGAHMLGEDAPEIIQGIAIAVVMGATKQDFDRTIGIHPTAAEEFVTLRTRTRVAGVAEQGQKAAE